MDLNKFARAITRKEGRKQNLSIGQVKEVIRLVFAELRTNKWDAFVEIFFRRNRR